MKKTTIMNAEGKFVDLELNLKDLWSIQTKESKRTIILGAASTTCSVASMFITHQLIKKLAICIGVTGAVATIISNFDAIKKSDSEENLEKINEEIQRIAKEHGIDINTY